MSIFGERLIQARKMQGLSQKDLALRTNVSRSAISGYETQGKDASYEVLIQLARVLGVTTDFLVGADDTATWSTRDHVANAFWNLEVLYEQASEERKAAMDATLKDVDKLLVSCFQSQDPYDLNATMDLFNALRRMTVERDADGEE